MIRPRPESEQLPSGRGVCEGSTFLAPAVCEAVLDGFGSDAHKRLLRDQVDAGVGVAAWLDTGLRVLDNGSDAPRGHQERVLLRGRVDDPGSDVSHAGATTVDRDDRRGRLRLAGVLQRGPGACGAGLVDRVDDVDVRVLLETVLHRRLRRCRLTLAVADAGDLAVAALDPEPLQEAVVSQGPHRRPAEPVEHPDP